VSWNGISVPAATPKAVVKVLTRAINEVLPSPDVQEKVSKLGMEMRGSNTRGDDGAHEKRHRQMGGGNREGRHSEA
jgi:tripartite-type tricarboxylate transporter receptor subunit TctC